MKTTEPTTAHKKRGNKPLSDTEPLCADLSAFNTILPAHHRRVLDAVAAADSATTGKYTSTARALRLVIEHAEKTMPLLLK